MVEHFFDVERVEGPIPSPPTIRIKFEALSTKHETISKFINCEVSIRI